MSGTEARQWTIAETHCLVKTKTESGSKLVNNYLLLHTLGQGRFGNVKLCERIANDGSSSSTTETGQSVSNATIPKDNVTSASTALPAFAPQKTRLFAMKIFSKRKLRRLKDYRIKKQVNDSALKADTAIMRMHFVTTALDRVYEEIKIMRSLYHRNIVLLFEVIDAADESDKLYMVLEYMAAGPCMVYRPSSKDFVSRVTGGVLGEDLARSYLSDILYGLQYLHQRHICHRDIKPENILLCASGRCHITDFGCAKQCFNDRTASDAILTDPRSLKRILLSDTVGTYQFFAPECCYGEPYDPFKVDIWAVGIVFFLFLFGKLPYASENIQQLFDEISRSTLTLPTTELSHSPECQNLLHRLLQKDPNQRITIEEALCHPWFTLVEDVAELLSF
ncbi:hypothetical protein CCR75_006704 [Bremia lactucae]|uniref:Protein kinase domain-containing protein n=1 Tax=Bremia lactucae TaxID=4779 RepID=A0A976FF10_BRELC|nr:hypothetical protein CCR75_006704 [Bremia lactucae]